MIDKQDGSKMYAFVYGSLKRGLHNHRVLGDAEFVKSTVTKDKYYMYGMGSFPAVTDKRKEAHIQGEVYSIDSLHLEDLDHLEGNGSFYKRKMVRLRGFPTPVWMYFIMDKRAHLSVYKMDTVDVVNGVQTWD